ncbi:unnamed protein product [Brassica rapa subsp. trilocularis]
MLISYLLHCLQNILMFLIRLFVLRRCTCVLRKMCLDAKAPHHSSTLPPTLPWKFNKPVQPNKGLTRQGNGHSEELRCVIAVIRHGDRIPKQKVKLIVTEDKLLNLMLKYNSGKPRAETKLKCAVQLQDLLDATRMLVLCTRVIVIQKTLNMLRSFAKLKQFLKSREPFGMAQ